MSADHPLVIDSRRLPRQPGASQRMQVDTAPDRDLGNDLVTIDSEPVPVELLVESVLDGILVSGSTRLHLAGECARCLDPLDQDLPVSFRQFFTYPGAEVETDTEEDADVIAMNGPLLDLRPAFRDAAVLALPLSPTCRPDCPGLCPHCGVRLAENADHSHERSDPRLAALKPLREKLTQPESEGD